MTTINGVDVRVGPTTTTIAVAQPGLRGPVGPVGPVGPQGAPGAQGPMGTLNVVQLTQTEYDALGTKVPNTIYVII